MNRFFALSMLILLFMGLLYEHNSASGAEVLSPAAAKSALSKAVQFYRKKVSVNGGSVFQVSADLKQREGEVPVGPREVWIEPPATGTVGLVYLQCWQLTGDLMFKEAFLETADGLIKGQLLSGGWGENIEFDPLLRRQYAYRVDQPILNEKLKNRTTFDDNKSQSSLTFLMLADREIGFQDARIHEAVEYALHAFRSAQYPNGAWPQQFTLAEDSAQGAMRAARFPKSWNRTYEKISYSRFYTLNDNTLCDLIQMMLLAHDVYQDQRWLDSALKGGDFLRLAQLPEPQPGWAQQYNEQMEPAWARKFEPPAITGSESQRVLEMLMRLYDRTGEEKFLKPVPRAIEYYRSLLLSDGQLARFYELGTNRPLYFTMDYKLVYSDENLPTHYGFKVSSKLDRLAETAQKLKETGPSRASLIRDARPPKYSSPLEKQAERVIQQLDERGAWVEAGRMKKRDELPPVDRIISAKTYSKNLLVLAEYLAAENEQPK